MSSFHEYQLSLCVIFFAVSESNVRCHSFYRKDGKSQVSETLIKVIKSQGELIKSSIYIVGFYLSNI